MLNGYLSYILFKYILGELEGHSGRGEFEIWNVLRNPISYYKWVNNYGISPSKVHIYGTNVHIYGPFGWRVKTAHCVHFFKKTKFSSKAISIDNLSFPKKKLPEKFLVP